MSDDQPTAPTEASEATEQLPVLRREALLPNERSRGLGTVAVVCTMAGVASGLALATTLMAMQVADTMSTRTCTYRSTVIDVSPVSRDHGFLGITYVFRDGNALVMNVMADTPAERAGIKKGDRVLSVDGDTVDSLNELQERIVNARPGYRPTIEIKSDHVVRTVNPILTAWPSPSD